MRILFYISTIRGGGAARVMVNVANGMMREGHDVCFVTNFPSVNEYELSEGIRRYNLEEVENKGVVLIKNSTRIRKLRRIIRTEDPDISVAFMRENNFRLMLSASGLRTKTVVSVRNDPAKEYSSWASKRLADFLYSRADGIVFQTEDAKSVFPEIVQKKSRIIINQVDDKFFRESSVVGKYTIACGRLNSQKNYPMMLNAFAKVLKYRPDEVLRIYGDGRLRDELEALVDKLGIADSVEFMGVTSDMPSVYKDARLLVMTSDYEGMPNAMLEALASSVPVISTDCPCGGPRMIIKDGINGYLIPVGDVDALVNVWKGITDNDLISLKKGAYESAQGFKSDSVLKKWVEYLTIVLES